MVMHNGKPLSGATVKYIPEKFLSDALTETATGVTNQTGMAMISLPTGSGPDACPRRGTRHLSRGNHQRRRENPREIQYRKPEEEPE